MFRDKKGKKRIEEIRRRQIEKVLREIQPGLKIPKEMKFQPYPKDYSEFLKEIKHQPKTLYEKSCAFAERILKIKPKDSRKLEEEIKTAYLNVTPSGVLSLSFLTLFGFLLASILVILFIGDFLFMLFVLLFGLGMVYYLYNYPASHARAIQVRMSSDIVLAVLYMVIYMRNSPNIEGAVKFAAENLTGPLAWDLKKLMWDVEVGVYSSVDQALVAYLSKWKDKNKEFAEALHLLRNSTAEGDLRRTALLDEAINVILNGTRERMKHYAQGLRLPVMLIHAMGVLLPVMGLVMFPIIVIFMSDVIKPIFIFIGYDILLPLFLFWYMNYILQTKPTTFSQPDISQAKGIPPIGKMHLFNRNIPIFPFALLVSLPFVFIGFIGFSQVDVALSVNYSLLIILGISLGIILYCILDSYQKIKIRKDIERIEDEFSEALFQLGNQIAGGTPIEVAVDKAYENLKSMRISDMFLTVSMNMKKLGFTFEQALFDKEYGAIWYYPSRLIRSIMQTVIQSAKKGIRVASMSMLTVSRYLKNMHNVKEEINEILGETVTSMKFLAMFLAPLIAGVTVTMAVIIIQILASLTGQLSTLMGEAASMGNIQGMLLFTWGGGGEGVPITPPLFQLIVGLYMIETAVLLSFFLNRLRYGEDAVGLRSTIASTLLFGVIIYIMSWFATYSVFGAPIRSLLTPFGG